MRIDEKRVSPRKDILHPVKFHLDANNNWSTAYLLDQSDSGILIATQNTAKIGSVIHIMMDSDTCWNGVSCELLCEIARVVEHKDDVILKFDLGCIIKDKKTL